MKIGAAVTARADKVTGSRAAAARYGKNNKAKRVTGTIAGTNGRGRSRKWVIFFPTLNKRTEFSSRSLEMVESGLPTTPSNCIDAGVQSKIVDEEVNAVDVGVDDDVNVDIIVLK